LRINGQKQETGAAMSTQTLGSTLGLVLLGTTLVAACGPSCPEVKDSLDEEEAMAGDVARVNALVDKRDSAMAEAGQGDHDQFYLQRLKFSVTAFELAVELQVRIIKISPRYENSDLYDEHVGLFNEIRCEIDDLVGMDGHEVSDRIGRAVQERHKQVGALLRKEGQVSGSELQTYLSEGIGGSDNE
jgi:hypothetical protein